MNKITLDKKNTLVNVANSILDHFGVKPFHDTFAPLDDVLKTTDKEKVALVLFDGMGKVIIEHYKDDIPFIYNHVFTEFKSVFPTTTVAATTAVTTGKYGIETGYIGWTQYFETRRAYLVTFFSADKETNEIYTPSVREKELKVDYLWDLINRTKKHNASVIQSFEFKKNKEDDFDTFFKKASELVSNNDFCYIYSTNPDHLLHENGMFNETVKECLIYLNNKLEELVNAHPDTLFILVADHGFCDSELIPIYEHEDFYNTLKDKVCSVEPRFAAFSVKDEEKFLELANKYYGKYFDIYKSEDLLKLGTFGEGEMRENVRATLKDYMLVAKDKYSFYDTEEKPPMIGLHAGNTKGEVELYMCLFNK